MIKEQVKMIILVVNLHPFLPGHEAKARAQFQNEGLHLAQNRRLNVRFRVSVAQPEKIQHVGIAKHEVGREAVLERKAANSCRISLSGFFDSAVRSNSIEPIFFSNVRVFHFSMRHISA